VPKHPPAEWIAGDFSPGIKQPEHITKHQLPLVPWLRMSGALPQFYFSRTVHHTHTNKDLIKYAATPLNQPQLCILTDYFNNYNFSKAQIIRSLMKVIELKHVGVVLM
jgi:hypothetical protein